MLPLPPEQKVCSIIHISDIHIRTGTPEECRYSEYKTVFERCISRVRDIADNATVCVITGDVFHQKLKGDSSSILLFNYLIGSLAKILPVWIIAGNHDFKQDRIDIPDMIEASLYNHRHKNVSYIKDTGCYIAGDTAVSVVSVKDTLKNHTAGGIKDYEELPKFPEPSQDSVKAIALFHGTVKHTYLDNEHKITNGYPLQWFGSHFDCILLGDIHKPQVEYDTKTQTAYGYAGSLLQQTFGEHPTEHGFLHWNINTQNTTFYTIPNDLALLKLSYKDTTWRLTQDIPLSTLKLPHHLKVRIQGGVPDTEAMQNLWNTLENHTLTTVHTRQNTHTKSQNNETEINHQAVIRECINTSSWSKYLHDKNYTYDETILNDATKLYINDGFTYVQGIKEKNKDIQKSVQEVQSMVPENKENASQFTIVYVSWNNMICFGENNYVNLRECDGMTLINGPNGIGKSGFLEIILLGLYGKPIPCRYVEATSSSVINAKKEKNTSASIRIDIEIENSVYQVKRTFTHQPKNQKKLSVQSSIIKNESTGEVLTSKLNETTQWIAHRIGSKEDFLTWCLISQGNDNDFLYLHPKEQKSLIDRTLCIDSLHAFITALDVSIRNHNKCEKELRNYVLEPTQNYEETEEMKEQRQKVAQAQKELASIQKELRYPIEQCLQEDLSDIPKTDDTDPEALYELRGKIGKPDMEAQLREIEIDAFTKKPSPPIKEYPSRYEECDDNPMHLYTLLKTYETEIQSYYDSSITPQKNETEDTLEKRLREIEDEQNYYKEITANVSRRQAYKAKDDYIYMCNEKDNIKTYKQKAEENEQYAYKIETLHNELTQLRKAKQNTQKSLDKTKRDTKDLPYNPECWACNKNPLILTKKQLEKDLHTYNNNINEKKREYAQWHCDMSVDNLRGEAQEMKRKYTKLNELIDKEEMLCQYASYADKFDKIDEFDVEYTSLKAKKAIFAKQHADTIRCKLQSYYKDYVEWNNYVYATITDRISKAEKSKRKRIIQEDYEKAQRGKELRDFIEATKYDIHTVDKERQRQEEKNKAVRKEYDTLTHRIALLKSMHNGLLAYRGSLYKETIIPSIIELINTYISHITDALSLQATFNDDDTFLWYIQRYGEQSTTLEKASGFERFMVGLSMRIALGALAKANKIAIPTQLFIDEGFVSLDENNLAKTPSFLNMLIDQNYKANIIVVSHLEKIKSASDTVIPIYRETQNGLSVLQYGTQRSQIQGKGHGTTTNAISPM